MFLMGFKIYEFMNTPCISFHLPKGDVAPYHQEIFLFVCLKQLIFLNIDIFMAFWDQNQSLFG